MSGAIEIVLILAAVGYVLVRRMMGEAAQAKRMLLLPAALVVVGLTQSTGLLRSPAALLFVLATCALSIVLGALRGASVRISDRGGIAFVRYTWVTVVLWAANLAVKFGANFVFQLVDPRAAAIGNSLFLSLGVGLLVEGLVVVARALRSDSQVIWAKGDGAAQHTRSALLDNLRESMNGRPVTAGRSRYGWDARQDHRH